MELNGPLTAAAILKAFPQWRLEAEKYQPDAGAIWSLKGLAKDVVVKIYLGTWCPDSRIQVGRYLKIMEKATTPRIRTEFTGLPRDEKARSSILPRGRNIDRLPTFIVLEDGREKGRIVETPHRSLEEDLAVLILG